MLLAVEDIITLGRFRRNADNSGDEDVVTIVPVLMNAYVLWIRPAANRIEATIIVIE